MNAYEQLARYAAFISVMTEREQCLLAEGRLYPSILQICQWCEALLRRNNPAENRIAEALERQENRRKTASENLRFHKDL